MDQKRAKEKCKYRDKLDEAEKVRYLKLMELLNGLDPYEIPNKEWSSNADLLPPVDYPNILKYLVLGVSFYTLQEFLCYKGLEAHQFVTDGSTVSHCVQEHKGGCPAILPTWRARGSRVAHEVAFLASFGRK